MKIAVLPGDGIGKEVTAEAVKVLRAAVGAEALELTEAPVGGAGVEAAGDPLPPRHWRLRSAPMPSCSARPACLATRPSPTRCGRARACCGCAKHLGLFANFRPAFLFPELVDASTLKREVVEGLDIMILRELTGDLYFGEPRGITTNAAGEREAFNTMRYSEGEVERIAHVAFETARKRRRKVCSVDKANVLETMQLWREVVTRVGKDYPDVELTHLFVDAAAMMLMRAPKQFDVIVTGNVFGDILSDAAAMLTGSIGMLPSASLGKGTQGTLRAGSWHRA